MKKWNDKVAGPKENDNLAAMARLWVKSHLEMLSNMQKCRRGESNEQVFYVLSVCFVGFLFLVVVHHTCLCIPVVFRCCYTFCYMLFHGCAFYRVATWSCLGVAT
jgi:hypothetical protein